LRRGGAGLAVGVGLAAAGLTAAIVRRRAADARRRRAVARVDRASRSVELARLGTKASASYATFAARSRFADEERRAALRSEFELRTAEQVADALGHMKGAVMKLGQMASYLDQGLPEPVREVLAQLQTDAPPMAAELAADMVCQELGAAPDRVFAEWERSPMAAASIGQVHRAVTHDGREVAVKVQYPGVEEAIRADLDNSDLLFGMMGMLFPGLDPKPIVAELRDRLLEELDYRTEAANQTLFAEQYRGHPTIHVPAVVPGLSAERVLTTELAVGATWSELLEWPQDERNLAAETIYRFAFGGIYRFGAFNGDPHPGNYLFRPGGRVTFLDYGLCKIFTPDEVAIFEGLITSLVLHDDVDAFIRQTADVGFVSGIERFGKDALVDYFRHFYEFVMTDEVRTITPEYASESIRRFFDLTGPHAEIIRSANLPPSMVIIQRINLGLFALLGELHATANWRRIAEEIWPFTDGAPSTPMGEAIAEWERVRSR
jgi:predicted unusual protein kinase regulating ubiquinone biosynthesis (AarF/ABC1/UbiB family)